MRFAFAAQKVSQSGRWRWEVVCLPASMATYCAHWGNADRDDFRTVAEVAYDLQLATGK